MNEDELFNMILSVLPEATIEEDNDGQYVVYTNIYQEIEEEKEVTNTALDDLYLAIFTTALEGGIGYWAESSNYHWSFPDGSPDTLGFYSDVTVEGITDEEHNDYTIGRSVIVKGYRLATKPVHRNALRWSTTPPLPPDYVTEDTDWDFDANDADMIVQLGLFGEVVFG